MVADVARMAAIVVTTTRMVALLAHKEAGLNEEVAAVEGVGTQTINAAAEEVLVRLVAVALLAVAPLTNLVAQPSNVLYTLCSICLQSVPVTSISFSLPDLFATLRA